MILGLTYTVTTFLQVTVKDTNQHLNILDDDIKGIIKVHCSSLFDLFVLLL